MERVIDKRCLRNQRLPQPRRDWRGVALLAATGVAVTVGAVLVAWVAW